MTQSKCAIGSKDWFEVVKSLYVCEMSAKNVHNQGSGRFGCGLL